MEREIRGQTSTLHKIEEQPVTVELVSKADLAKLRTNPSIR